MSELVISIAALIVSAIAVIISVVFFCKSAKALQHAVNILGGLIDGTVRGQDISVRRNDESDVIGLIITAHVNDRVGLKENLSYVLKNVQPKVPSDKT
jgi:hypothetical protein